jgi:pentose-5-phosphate-3-epimerase
LILGHSVALGVDGGVTKANIAEVAALGANVVVSGSAIFDGGDPLENIGFLMEVLRGTQTSSNGFDS